MLIAQISDTHIKPGGGLAYDGRVDTYGALVRCIDRLLRLDPAPDVVLLTGDLVDAGQPTEYAALTPVLCRLPMPLYPIPGNHDERGAFRAAFPDLALPAEGTLHYVVERHPVRLILLDSLVPGEPGGCLGGAQLAWLDATLAERPRQPTLIAVHHPPFLTGIGHMDAMTLHDRAAFAEVLSRHDQIERVVCGHLHRPIQAMVGGRLAMTAPGTSHQVALDLRPGAPAAFALEPPAFLLHLWRAGEPMVTHLVPVDDSAGPYPFFDGAGKLLA